MPVSDLVGRINSSVVGSRNLIFKLSLFLRILDLACKCLFYAVTLLFIKAIKGEALLILSCPKRIST